ncbi:MAG: hypothetical protein M0Z56_10170, partial [Desulfobacteraceae bacterium]|nr:hypothetical protein [Desulfobacteraceae bacterium]
MSDHSTKRIAIRFCTPDVIDVIEQLPKGFKSMIVESAMTAYLDSEVGKRLLAQLNLRKKQLGSVSKSPAPRHEALFNQIKGDF